MRFSQLLQYVGLVALNGATVQANVRSPLRLNLTGHIEADKVFTYLYEPIEVPKGVTSLAVSYTYSLKDEGNTLDIGIFDQRGIAFPDGKNDTTGARGWSGYSRDNFTITNAWATPGYIAGPINPGTWHIGFGPSAMTEGGIDWKAQVEMSFEETDPADWFKPSYAATNLDTAPILSANGTQQAPARWLRGDFHLHTIHSDGSFQPEELVEAAISRQLDFMFFTEHNTCSGNDVYGVYEPEGRDLLIGRGMEVTTRHGHWNALGLERSQTIEWRYHPEDGEEGYPAAAAQVHRSGGFVSVNHPYLECDRCDWALDWDHNDAIEVWNGPWDEVDQQALELWQKFLVDGRRYTAIGGSDAHAVPNVPALPTTIVLSAGLTQAAIVDGVRRGYVYMAKEPEMSLSMTVESKHGAAAEGYHIGQTVPAKDAKGAHVKLDIAGFGTNGTTVSWVTEDGYKNKVTAKSDEDSMLFPLHDVQKFVRVEIRDGEDSVLGMTNPVFVE